MSVFCEPVESEACEVVAGAAVGLIGSTVGLEAAVLPLLAAGAVVVQDPVPLLPAAGDAGELAPAAAVGASPL